MKLTAIDRYGKEVVKQNSLRIVQKPHFGFFSSWFSSCFSLRSWIDSHRVVKKYENTAKTLDIFIHFLFCATNTSRLFNICWIVILFLIFKKKWSWFSWFLLERKHDYLTSLEGKIIAFKEKKSETSYKKKTWYSAWKSLESVLGWMNILFSLASKNTEYIP